MHDASHYSLFKTRKLNEIIGNWLANGMIWLYGVTGFFGIALLAVLRPFLVMTGMHTAFTPYLLNAMATVGYEPFYSPACTVANLNQGISCLAVAIKSKRSDVKSLSASSGFTCNKNLLCVIPLVLLLNFSGYIS